MRSLNARLNSLEQRVSNQTDQPGDALPTWELCSLIGFDLPRPPDAMTKREFLSTVPDACLNRLEDFCSRDGSPIILRPIHGTNKIMIFNYNLKKYETFFKPQEVNL